MMKSWYILPLSRTRVMVRTRNCATFVSVQEHLESLGFVRVRFFRFLLHIINFKCKVVPYDGSSTPSDD